MSERFTSELSPAPTKKENILSYTHWDISRSRQCCASRKEGNVLFNDALHTFYLRLYGRKEGNVLFNDALDTFYLRLYGVEHMVNDHSDSEKGNPLSPLLILISSKGYFILYAPSNRQDSTYHTLCYTRRGVLAKTRHSSMGPPWMIDPTTQGRGMCYPVYGMVHIKKEPLLLIGM